MGKKNLWLVILLLFLTSSMFGGYTYIDGRWSDARYAPTHSVQEHYDMGCSALFSEQYEEALTHFLIIASHFYDSPFYPDSLFYAGECYLNLSEFDLADKQFSLYLGLSGQTRHFEKVFMYKYGIAESYRKGSMRHLFGRRKLPKFSPSKEAALKLYEEVIVALPGQEVAARALFGKAKLLKKKRDYQESVEALKTLTRRFPRHPLGAQGYVLISKIYLDQSRLEAQNPDYLALAQINLERMKKSFPSSEEIVNVETNLHAMKEIYGSSLIATGRFYEKKGKPHAALIYYQDAINRYPETKAAEFAQNRLNIIR